ncbi:MAG: hypothetical protein U1B80_05305, partial [Anaerolineaceae bacterium]|nr:hypothetical protein [Anaerolineaceae bacterium]
MQRLIKAGLLLCILFAFLQQVSSVMAQSQPLPLILFEELVKTFKLPGLNQTRLSITPQPSGQQGQTTFGSNRFTEGTTKDSTTMYMTYHQGHETQLFAQQGYVPTVAVCKSKVVVKTHNLAKMSTDQKNELTTEAKNGFPQAINKITQDAPGLKLRQQVIGDTTIYILSGQGSGPGLKDVVGSVQSIEKDILMWMRGEWVFTVDREMDKNSGENWLCGKEFENVPPAIRWAEAIINIGERIGMFTTVQSEIPDPVEPALTPTPAWVY